MTICLLHYVLLRIILFKKILEYLHFSVKLTENLTASLTYINFVYLSSSSSITKLVFRCWFCTYCFVLCYLFWLIKNINLDIQLSYTLCRQTMIEYMLRTLKLVYMTLDWSISSTISIIVIIFFCFRKKSIIFLRHFAINFKWSNIKEKRQLIGKSLKKNWMRCSLSWLFHSIPFRNTIPAYDEGTAKIRRAFVLSKLYCVHFRHLYAISPPQIDKVCIWGCAAANQISVFD